jgi:hypothetical protein
MNSLFGAFIFLVIGFIELMIFNRWVYHALRWRYEAAKVTGTQGVDPSRIETLIKFQSLVVLPILGYLLGDRIWTMNT